MIKFPNVILDRQTLKEILQLTCGILHHHFFYEKKTVAIFLSEFTDVLQNEIRGFINSVETEILDDLLTYRAARFYFTCHFVSTHLRKTLIEKLHFSEQELYAFENVVSKYTGDMPDEKSTKHKRTHY